MITYRTNGTCSREIIFDIADGKITEVKFIGGCSGSLQAVSRMVIGKRPEEVVGAIKGIRCRNGTSCPDQLSKALERYITENKNA